VFAIFDSSLTPAAAKAIVLIATVGQLFCGMACVTSGSRMCYAFSRDRAIPGHRLWTRLNHHRVPAYAVMFMSFWALVVTLPALAGDGAFPWPFFAVTSITVIGLYIAYVIPVYLRWRKGDAFQPGPWTLGRKYRWINPAAILLVIVMVIIFCLPFVPSAVPGNENFDWKTVNYAPITVGVVVIAVGLWWVLRARHTFTGPVRTVKMDDTGRVLDEDAPIAGV
jgi:amino acid transporter